MYSLSEAEQTWSKEAVKRCINKNGKISAALVRSIKLTEEYKKKFGKTLTPNGMYNRLYRINFKMNPNYKRRGVNAAEVSNYLVFVKITGQTAGFETEAEVKSFIETNQVIGNNNIRIFKYVPVNVEYKVSIGE